MLQLQQLILFRSRLCPPPPPGHITHIALPSVDITRGSLNGDGLSRDRRISPINPPPSLGPWLLNRINFDRPVKCQSVRSGGAKLW